MVFINKEQASSFLLSRNRRENTGVEEFGEGNIEQECMEEVCNYEEAREIFETDVPGLNKFWANYINPTTTPPPTTKPPETEARMHSEDNPDTATSFWPIIVIVLVIGFLVALFFVCWRRRKSNKSEKDKQQETNDLLAQHRHVDMGHSATGTFGRYELDLKPIVHSSSSRSQSTQQSNSSGGLPPPYGDQRSDSVISSASRSQYVIQDPQLARDVKSCLIDRKKVTVGELLKEGNFGAVYKGILNNHGREQRIAIKSLKCVTDSSSFESFMREGVLMKEFNHSHVLSLIGVCEGDQSPKLLLPFCEKGDLRAYLRDPKIVVTVSNLVKFCQEICDGMAYLASKKFVHRDLAARNCMVDNKCRIKVSDFGLSRVFANERDYYRAQSTIELPLKWMAPESIKFNYYNEKTDVWSFGITCWEVFSRAIIPYPTVEAQNILTYLDSGKRLAKPAHCPDEIYEMMNACWREKGEDRPTFNEIKPVFEAILGRAHQVPERQKNRYSEPPKAYNKAKAVGRSNTERPSSASPYDKNFHQGSMIPQNGYRSVDRRDRPRPKERTLR